MISKDAQLLVTQLNKRFGTNTVVTASDVRSDLIPRITSGSLAMDYILGGGFPGNQWNELIGEEHSGKTLICLKTIAANQKLDPNYTTVWIAVEQWVPEYAEMLDVDMSRVILVDPKSMEEAYDAAIAVVKTRAVDAVVIDSLPALSPGQELEKDMGEATVGRGALLTNKFFRVVNSAMKRSMVEQDRPILGLMVNQWRMKIGVMYGDPKITPGGLGKNYAYFTRLEVKRDNWIEIGSGKSKVRVGISVKVRTLKNKVAPPQRVATVDFYFADGGLCPAGEYDFAKEICALAEVTGVITRSSTNGGSFVFGDRKWKSRDNLYSSIREEIDLKEDLSQKVLTVKGMPMVTDEE